MKKLSLLALASSVTLLALAAHAEPAAPEGDAPPPPPHAEGGMMPPKDGNMPFKDGEGRRGKRPNFLFKAMDTNADGKVTREEHDVFISARFKETDTNGDNAITEEEMKAYGEKKHAERMQKMLEERKAMAEKQGKDKPEEAAPAEKPAEPVKH